MNAPHPARVARPPLTRRYASALSPQMGRGKRNQRGVNLIELIISIVIISIAVGGVLLVFTQTIRFSADPMIQQQAVAIAEGYMDEILARPVNDPDPGVTETGGSEEGAATVTANRRVLDDVSDYNGLNQVPTDQNGNALGLNEYNVSVLVARNINIGPTIPAGSQVPASRVEVTVTRPPVVNFTLTGYRAN